MVKQRIPQTLKPKLTIRMSLSFHAKVFDPLGLVSNKVDWDAVVQYFSPRTEERAERKDSMG